MATCAPLVDPPHSEREYCKNDTRTLWFLACAEADLSFGVNATHVLTGAQQSLPKGATLFLKSVSWWLAHT